MNRTQRQVRSIPTAFETREDGDALHISGYFAVFDSNYDIADGLSESLARGAFTDTLGGDIRALVNHDTTLVLGRTAAHTLELRQDDHGLWGDITINPKDSDAVNLYERVKRGDVSQCSFGFDIASERADFSDNGSVHWTIEAVDLYEVSCVTFPAYSETNISARSAERDIILKRTAEAWRKRMEERINGITGIDASKADRDGEAGS